MDLVGPIIDVLKCLGGPTCTYVDHHRKPEERMNELQEEAERLNALTRSIELRKEAELQMGKILKEEVKKWLEGVQRINGEIQSIDQKVKNVSFFSRARLGKRIAQTIDRVEKLIERGEFSGALVIDDPSIIGVAFPLQPLEGETTVKEKIWNHLMGDEIGMIGVCGLGGIGKTTIMKHLHNRLLMESKARFNNVIWVTVSSELNISRLQEDIAEKLGIGRLSGDEQKRTATLMDKLEKTRYVLILDDVWKKFDLLDVGIPIPTSSNGSKVVITSRSIEVCKSMGCEIIQVQKLSDQESMKLFLDHVGHKVLEVPSLKETVRSVVQECDGLPLAIVVIAGSMKGIYDVHEWKNALWELRHHVTSVKGTGEEIYERLKFSYDRLGDSNIKTCFLYCSLQEQN